MRRVPVRAVLLPTSLIALIATGALSFADSIGGLLGITQDTVGAGGRTASPTYALDGTVGQPATGLGSGPGGTIESGIWTGSTDRATSTDPHVPRVPQVHRLDQNAPNPFNPTTAITFGLPRAGHVELVLFDPRGRKVRTLVDGHREAGEHQVVFDGRGLASGVYHYRLSAESFQATRQMVLVK